MARRKVVPEVLTLASLTDHSTAHPGHALPEGVAVGTRFRVADSARSGGPPRTSVMTKEFFAPLDDGAVARGLRLHELSHLRYSPADGPACALRAGFPNEHLEIVAAVEDARVNLLVQQNGQYDVLRAGYWSVPATKLVTSPTQRPERRLLLAAIAHATGERLNGAIDGPTLSLVQQCLQPVFDRPGTFDSTLASARRFARFFQAQHDAQRYRDSQVAEHGEQAAQASADAIDGAVDFDRSVFDDAWAPMTITYPPRPHAVTPKGRAALTHRASDSGTLYRYPHRYLLDQRVFASQRRAPGGTLVIDHSGSMEIDSEQLLALLDCAPQTTVADYGGRGHPAHGTLRVLIKDRRAADPDLIGSNKGIGGHNCIDGPVADWLAQQPKPRVWVTDGKWTGARKQPVTDELKSAVLTVCARAGILILPTLGAALTYFQGRVARRIRAA